MVPGNLIVQICSFLWVDSNKEYKLLISKKSRSDVQHHSHTEILGNCLRLCDVIFDNQRVKLVENGP